MYFVKYVLIIVIMKIIELLNKNNLNKLFFTKAAYLQLLFLLICTNTLAQGSTCSTATTISIGSCITNSSPNGTSSDVAPIFSGCGNGNNTNNITWYSFVVSGGSLNVTITAIGNRNLAFQLFSSSTNNCLNLVELACVNDVGGSNNSFSTETVTTNLANGTYFIKTLSSGGNNMILSSLCISADPTISSLSSNNGCPNDTFTITGTNFTGTTAVTIGGTPTTFTVNSSTSISAIIGNGTSGFVQVINPFGSVNSSTTFTVNPSPTNLTLSASNSTVCRNSTQAITASLITPTETIYSENFNTTPNWTYAGTNNGLQGIYSTTNNAGGVVNEVALTYNANRNGSYIIYPLNVSSTDYLDVNIENLSSLNFNFKYFFDTFIGPYTREIHLDISTDGINFTSVWFETPSGTTNSNGSPTINLDTYLGNSSLYFRFRYTGDTYGMDNWYIDDVLITGSRNVTWSPITNLFTDANCTIPYVAGSHALNVWAKPDATTTYSATTTNGICNKTSNVTYTIDSAIWSGSWSSLPTSNKSITFNSDYTSSGNIEGCDCTINSGNIVISSNDALILQNELNINGGTLTFENDATLLQIENASNTGQINYKRTANNINGYDYVYWSSPVFGNGTIGQNINTIYSSPTPGPKYFWNTIANNNNGALGNIGQGLWQNAFNQVMETGKGYIMRGSNNLNLSPTDIESTFIGIPTNGDLNIPIQRGDYTGLPYNGLNGAQITNLSDNFNLIGNPYPSAINILEFLSQNSSVILGNVNLWQHSDGLSNSYNNPFYGSFTYNYNVNNYNTINFTGSTTPSASEIIKTGQAFFVKMIDGPATTANVIFNNSMRRDASNLPYNNSGFYRTNTNQNETVINRNRIWLDLVKDNNCERTLIGYVDGATNLEDHFYDARLRLTNRMLIYSLMNEKTYSIQGKSNPFDTNDIVPIGIKAIESGNYSIAINTVDGLFEGSQEIYLKDELLNITHNLKTAPYTFTTTNGVHNNRFKIVYQNTTLDEASYDIKTVNIYKENSNIHINSGNEIMNNVTVYDISGRIIVQESAINNNSISIDISNIQDQVLILNIVTSERITITKKIL